MKCLQIHNDYLIPGGETKSVKLIADVMEENGIEVIRYYKNNQVIKDGGIFKKVAYAFKSIYNMDTVAEINNIIKENSIDFALIHNTSPIISNSVYSILIKNNIKIYKYIQNYNLVCLNGSLELQDKCIRCNRNNLIGVINKCYKKSMIFTASKYISKKIFDIKYLRSIHGYIAISEFVKQKHVDFGIEKDKISVIHHFVEELNIPKSVYNETYYIYVGRLSKGKGIETLINAFMRLKEKKLYIMGEGELKQYIFNFIKDNNIKNIEILGYKTGEEKDKVISNAYACIVPSEWEEPFGRTVIESFQLGVPVIASESGGLKELVIESWNGYKFKSGSVDGLINKIDKISKLSIDEYMNMSFNCLQDINSRFSKDVYIKKINSVITN